MADYAQVRQDRAEFLTALATFTQSAGPILKQYPNAAPHMLKLLQWAMAGFKGSSTVEGVLDQMIQEATQAQAAPKPPPPPDPQVEAIKVKAGADMGKAQAQIQKTKLDMQKAILESNLDMRRLALEARQDGLDAIGLEQVEAP